MTNIVSNMELLNKSKEFGMEGDVISFNESMCEGTPEPKVFMKAFVEERLKTLNLTQSRYQFLVLSNLDKVNFKEEINLYFGKDMFSVVNLITLLAGFENMGFNRKINWFILDYKNSSIEGMKALGASGFYELYQRILINKEDYKSGFKLVDDIVPLYLAYNLKDKKKLKRLIGKSALTGDELINELMKNNPKYGLGYNEWKKWIEE